MANVLIIGGGVAGLSAGIYACLNGYDTTICEAHAIPGGCLTSWERQGYHIDNCIHWLTGTNKLNRDGLYSIWCDLNVLSPTVKLYQRNSLFTCYAEGKELSLHRDLKKLETQMLTLSPVDAKEIESFIRAVDTMMGIIGYGGSQREEKYGFWKIVPRIPLIKRYLDLTVSELAERFHHPALKSFFSSFMPDWFGSFALVFVVANFCSGNADLPLGGSEAMAKRMTDRFVSLGGKMLCRKEVTQIHREGSKAIAVGFSDGTSLSTDWVISTIDPACLFRNILDAPMPKKLEKMYRNEAFRRFSSFHVAFACDLKELSFDGDYTIEIPEDFRAVLPARYLLVRHDSHEKGYAPDGKSLIQILSYCDEETCRAFIHNRNEYKAHYDDWKQHIAEAEKALITSRFPELQAKLSCIDVWTPATYQRYVHSDVGTFESFALPKKFYPKMISPCIPGLDNVLLAGQWLQVPGGLPIAAMTGKAAVDELCRRDR